MREQRSIAVAVALGAIVGLYALLSCIGITWGLPSRRIDAYLFGDSEPWSGEKIFRLAHASGKFSPSRGSDVDADPLRQSTDEPILLTGTEEDVAKIYLRYRLYTYQPDEMITMMALAGMRPRQLDLDPRLYQYGGLFLYPVGALIKLCGGVGLIDVRNDIVFYLDHPDEFGKFYVVARAYSAVWGALGVFLVFAIARRLSGNRAGLLAALLFALLPVVTCMAHEGKPHLPGAALMLAAVYFAMRGMAVEEEKGPHSGPYEKRVSWVWMCVCCGAALGMVLSSWPVFVLIPLVAWIRCGRSTMVGGAHPTNDKEKEGPHRGPYGSVIAGTAIAGAVYCVTNPYVMINLFVNREVLRSNFGNSLAMYEVSRIGEGLMRVVELTVEGATLPVVVLGVVALGVAVWRRNGGMLVLLVPAAVFFLQFVLIGAGKPAEYGRFGIFYEAGLAIGASCCLVPRKRFRNTVGWTPMFAVVVWVMWFNGAYLQCFAHDTERGSRAEGGVSWGLAQAVACAHVASDPNETYGDRRWDCWRDHPVAVVAEPAPYCCPPLPFDRSNVYLFPSAESARRACADDPQNMSMLRAVDGNAGPLPVVAARWLDWRGVVRWLRSPWGFRASPISWANKPIELVVGGHPRIIGLSPPTR